MDCIWNLTQTGKIMFEAISKTEHGMDNLLILGVIMGHF